VNHFEVTDSAYAYTQAERDVPAEWTIGQIVSMLFLGGCNGPFIQK
jgi:hypothetical protein